MLRKNGLNLEVDSKIRTLLKKYRPSQIDEMALVTCPFYESGASRLTSAYRLIHDFATSRVLAKLQLRFNEVKVLREFSLEFGKVDGVISRLSLANGDNPMLFIEIKTGRLKLVQSAIYTYFQGVKTLVAELKTGEVLKIDVETAVRLIEEVIKHIDDREKLRELEKRVPGRDCVYCDADCDLKVSEERSHNPLKSLSNILENVDTVVEKILVEVTKEVRRSRTSKP